MSRVNSGMLWKPVSHIINSILLHLSWPPVSLSACVFEAYSSSSAAN